MPTSYPQTINVPAADAVQSTRKALSLCTIAKLNPESLALIAKAAAKPGADAKLKQYASFL